MSFFILLQTCLQAQAFVNFQTGYINDFYVWASSNILYQSLTPGRSDSKIFYFDTAFQKIPQIFITSICYDLNAGNQGFEFSIYDITTTSFSIQITATQTSRFNGYCFRYQAFDDRRRLVISYFNQQNPVTATLKYSHSNPSFSVGIISPISLSYLGAISYHLSVVEVTQTDFTYSIEVNGLIQIGYQILLGTKDAFYHQQYGGQYLQTCFPCTIPEFTYQTGWEDSELYSSYTGFSYGNSRTLRMRLSRYDGSSNLQNAYTVETWAGSYLNSAYHRFGAIRRNWQPGFYTSFKCYDFYQVRYQDDSITDSFRLIIQELSIDINLIGTTNYQINTNILTLTINLIRIISSGNVLTTKLLPFDSCSDQYFIQTNNYLQNANIIKQISKFKIINSQISTLIVTIDINSIKLEHQYIDYEEQKEIIAHFLVS